MGNMPWQGDACSLVDEFRAGRRSPLDELRATYEAVDRSDLNAFSYLPREQAEAAALAADLDKPFGGVPIGVKELDDVKGWPATHACAVFADEVAPHTTVMVQRMRDIGGAVLAGQTTASEFGGVNVTRTVLHGSTHNPWHHGRTPGGSSGGSAAAVAGGLVTIATGGDGGGSIRIPAGFTGLFGLKATFGRIPMAPRVQVGNYTTVVGCLARQRARHRPLVRRVQRPRPSRHVQPAARRRVGARPRFVGRLAARRQGRRRARLGRSGRLAGHVGRCCPRRPITSSASLVSHRSTSTRRCRRWARRGASAA